jgi:hypothetical protein
MRNSFGLAIVSVVLFSAVLAATSCGPTPTPPPAPTPTIVVVTTPLPDPTATPEPVASPALVEEEEPTPTPEPAPEEVLYLPELPRVTCEELKQAMDDGLDLVLVDTRMDLSFNDGHIPGALNIPDTPLPPLTEAMVMAKLMALPMDKLIFLYCD